MKTASLCVVTQRVVGISRRRFGTIYRSNLQRSRTQNTAGRPSTDCMYTIVLSSVSQPGGFRSPLPFNVSTPCSICFPRWLGQPSSPVSLRLYFFLPSLHFTSVYFPFASPLPSFLFFYCLPISSPASYSPLSFVSRCLTQFPCPPFFY